MEKLKRINEWTKNKELLTDIEQVNKFATGIYVICSVLYAVIGYFLFYSGVNTDNWQPAIYYALLFLPLILVGLDFKESKRTEELRYSMYIPAMFFYLYLLILDKEFVNFVFALCLIGIATLYYDNRFSRLVASVIFGMHIAVVIYYYLTGNDHSTGCCNIAGILLF